MFTVNVEGSAARVATTKAVWEESAFKAIRRVKTERMKDIPWDHDPTLSFPFVGVVYPQIVNSREVFLKS